MDFRHYFLRNQYADDLYMNVLRPLGYLSLIFLGEKLYIKKRAEEYKYLQTYHNKYKGRRCFIVGTGPSLKKEDLLLLKDEVLIGLNSLCLWKDILPYIDYFFVTDFVAYRKLYNDLPKGCFVSNQCEKKCGDLSARNFRMLPVSRFNYFVPYTKKFSLDISKCIYDFNSVAFLAVQFAVYAGFSEIYLLGIDCNYNSTKIYAIDHGIRHRKEYMQDVGGKMIDNFKFVDDYLKTYKVDVKIFNASEGGMLEVFPRIKLKELLKNHSCE